MLNRFLGLDTVTRSVTECSSRLREGDLGWFLWFLVQGHEDDLWMQTL